jgi:hypothetical protein
MTRLIPRNSWLIAGGVGSAGAALLHLAIIAGGPAWYRYFGAGERIAHMAERGHGLPALYAVGIASLLALAAAYAFAGAGPIPRLPLMRTALAAIACGYGLRGLGGWVLLIVRPDLSGTFVLWSSVMVAALGLAYAIGCRAAWPALSARN